jgi:hypothetical protein
MKRENSVNSLQVGCIINFGAYKWRVLDVQDGKALIITEHALTERQEFDSNLHNFIPESQELKNYSVSWETCTLRRYLNNDFLQIFSQEELNGIVETQISNPGNMWYDTAGCNDTRDKVFLLSLTEIEKYFVSDNGYTKKQRKTHDNDSKKFVDIHNVSNLTIDYNADSWWLRTPGETYCFGSYVINYVDFVMVAGLPVGAKMCRARPALWLNIDVFLSCKTHSDNVIGRVPQPRQRPRCRDGTEFLQQNPLKEQRPDIKLSQPCGCISTTEPAMAQEKMSTAKFICLLIFTFPLSLYFLPTLIAWRDESDDLAILFIINFLGGWTGFGWAYCLYVALTGDSNPWEGT